MNLARELRFFAHQSYKDSRLSPELALNTIASNLGTALLHTPISKLTCDVRLEIPPPENAHDLFEENG